MRTCLPLLLITLLAACSDPVDIDSGFAEAQPVVDAWLTDEPVAQTIYLWQTQDYFANAAPPPLTGAEVTVTSNDFAGVSYEFVEQAPGEYVWEPTDTEPTLSGGGSDYFLSVSFEAGGAQRVLTASSTFNRVPDIDSLVVNFEETQIGLEEGLYAELFARDLPGVGDRYLIRTTINDTLLNRPGELNLAADAAFDGGTASDGIPFILPIRRAVNKLDDDGAPVALQSGDRVAVEIWSLTEEAFQFLSNAAEQIQNADSGLFSVPVVSTRGNVRAEGGAEAIGMFSLSRVSAAAVEVD